MMTLAVGEGRNWREMEELERRNGKRSVEETIKEKSPKDSEREGQKMTSGPRTNKKRREGKERREGQGEGREQRKAGGLEGGK